MALLPTHWYYNTESGQLTQGDNLENLGNNLVGGLGWHELNVPGSATQAQAAAEAKKEFPAGKAPTTAGISAGSIAKGAAADAGQALGSGVNLTFGNTTGLLGRTLKVVLGLTLIIAGVINMTGAKSVVTTAAKAAVI
jgi:hypothetical protein